MQAALDSIVCHTPLNNLGFSRKGSALTFSVAFQALRTGLFEVGWGRLCAVCVCEGCRRGHGWWVVPGQVEEPVPRVYDPLRRLRQVGEARTSSFFA